MKQHQRIIGFIFLFISIVSWIIIFIIPFMNLDNATKGTSIAICFVVGEGAFILSLTLLGKELWEKIKSKFKEIFSRKKHE